MHEHIPDIEKLDLSSPDLVNQNIEKFAALFPNCVAESADGKVVDSDLLKQELSYQVVEGNKERHGFLGIKGNNFLLTD